MVELLNYALGSKLNAANFYNLDETGLSLDPKRKDCIKKIQRMLCASRHRKTITGNICFLTLFIKEKVDTFRLLGSLVHLTILLLTSLQVDGWMEDFAFEAGFKHSFINYTEDKQKPIILFFDGHTSHLTYDTILAAKQHGIHIVCLPPKTSFALQPLWGFWASQEDLAKYFASLLP